MDPRSHDREALLERFCRYVKVETTAVEETTDYPSSLGQLELGRMLAEELRAMGVADAQVDGNGIVRGTVPGTALGAPAIAWLAHMDTSPESSAKDVRPIVHRGYAGGDIPLPADPAKAIRVEDNPHLASCIGKTLVTTDGRTLLGADDKAGIAVIMTAAARLLSGVSEPHAPVRIVFTCDEEVGRGVDKLDPATLGVAVGYTLDGESAGTIENETFSADQAIVTVTGVNIHPGLARGRMVNAIRIASQFVARMPWHRLAPETTSGREPFLHPYSIEGGVAEAKVKIILRSFETADLAGHAELLRAVAKGLEAEHPKARIAVEIKKQYRNMAEGLGRDPRAVALVDAAMRRAGLTPTYEAIRGGTDGSRLTELGLPTPNIGVGMHNYHSPLEYACLDEMEKTVDVLVALAGFWGKERA